MGKKTPITVAYGDGIGPEIMAAAIHIVEEAGAEIEQERVEIGEKVYLAGFPAGIEDSTWESIRRTKVFFKAPITTPQGGGFKSLNVTIRTTLGLYANIRPCVSYHPYVKTKHPKMNVVIVRENEEDLYAGIEYQQSADVCESLKLISRPGTEKIVRYAFEFAKNAGRKKVTCFTKDNIMKFSDGLFHSVYDEIAKEYPMIENEHWIVDIGAAKLADTPENFDVIVMPNLYGDILSDVAAQIAGSVGLAGSANIGEAGAMFEAIHGSAPRRAGQNLANPSGLIHASILMMLHIGQPEVATRIHNAWLCTLEQGIHTYDIYDEAVSTQKVGTKEFAEAIVKNLGKIPENFDTIHYSASSAPKTTNTTSTHSTFSNQDKTLAGVDVFLQCSEGLEVLQKTAEGFNEASKLKLSMIANRGAKIWPNKITPETMCIDQWRCRFMHQDKGATVAHSEIAKLLAAMANKDVDFLKTENLYNYNGQPGYTVSQDEQ